MRPFLVMAYFLMMYCDITKHEASRVALALGPGAQQHTNWRSRNRFRPYEPRDSSVTGSFD